jgi:hypothetical protein
MACGVSALAGCSEKVTGGASTVGSGGSVNQSTSAGGVPGVGGSPVYGAGGVATSTGGNGLTPVVDAGKPASDSGAPLLCSSEPLTSSSTALPSDVLFLVDRSSALACPLGGTGMSPFDGIRAAFAELAGMVATPLDFGIELYGAEEGDGGASCDSKRYEHPDIPIAPFPANATAIETAFAAHSPGEDAPLLPALTGAVTYAKTLLAAGAPAIVVVSGTEPVTCGAATELQNVAKDAALSGLQLMVITVPTPTSGCDEASVSADLTIANAIAGAGSLRFGYAPTGVQNAPYVVDRNTPMFVQRFLGTVSSAIDNQRANRRCSFRLPQFPLDSHADLTRSLLASKASAVVLSETTRDACGQATSGFFYDDPANPREVELCPFSCYSLTVAAMQSLSEPAVNWGFACE